MKNKATIYDIAEKLNVTVSTVSRALNDSKSISKKTKSAVWDMAKELNYTPNKLAASLKSGKTFTIGVLVPSTRVQFFASVIHSIENTLKQEGYNIILVQNNENLKDEVNAIKTLLEAQVDGIIASLSLETQSVSHFNEVIKKGKALILFDRTHPKLSVPSVSLDDFKAGYIATEHLLKQGLKHVAYIVPKQKSGIFTDRLMGYKSAIAEYRCKEYIHYSKLSIKDGENATEELIKDKIEAIIAGDDFTALGVLHKLKEKKRTDIAVVGFANEVFSEFITPTLTTIEQQPEKIGAECARIFLNIKEKSSTNNLPEKIVVEPILIVRESSIKKG